MIVRRVCFSKLGSTSASVTLDKLSSAATISWVCVLLRCAAYAILCASSSIQKVREPRLNKALLYCFQLVVLQRGVGMRLRRLMGVADQIVACWFSSIDLSNKAVTLFKFYTFGVGVSHISEKKQRLKPAELLKTHKHISTTSLVSVWCPKWQRYQLTLAITATNNRLILVYEFLNIELETSYGCSDINPNLKTIVS